MLTEAQARARAAAVKATFPTGTITVGQAQDMLMAMIDSQVGYASSSATWSRYGKPESWEEDWEGRQVYWCALGLSWAFEACFGARAAIAGIGLQTSNPHWPPAGWTATWLWLAWLRSEGLWVGMENAKEGSIIMESWGRTSQEVDHVEVARGPYRASDDSVPGYGFNTATGNVTAGAGVMQVRRYRRNIVGVYDPHWEALVTVYNAEVIAGGIIELTEEVTEALDLLGYPASVEGIREFQADHGLVVDGIVGTITSARLEIEVGKAVQEIKDHIDVLRRERTNAHVEETAKQDKILANQQIILANQEKLRVQNNTVGRIARETRDKIDIDAWIARFLAWDLYGFTIQWWLRRGFLGRKYDHPNYPYDPGSPADLEHRTAEATLGTEIAPYGAQDNQGAR